MSQTLAIELNDSGIIVSDGKQILVDSAGYCIDHGSHFVVGKEAWLQARLLSSQCRSQFWSNLAIAEKDTLNRADINAALWHLRHIWEQVSTNVNAVILTVPANFANTGLGVLLGLCKELVIPVKALVHHAVLSPRLLGQQGVTMHIEMQLHNVSMTQLDEDAKEFSVASTTLLDQQGYEQLYQQIAEAIAKVFVKETRFDPLHTAQAEQQLFNSLPGWLKQAQLQKGIECQIYDGQQVYQTTVDASLINTICRHYIDTLLDKILALSPAQSAKVCITNKLEELLGFKQQASLRGVNIVPLEHGHHAKQALRQSADIIDQDEHVYLIKQLPYHEIEYDVAFKQTPKHIETPSHVLFKYHAYTMQETLYFSLDDSADDLSLYASSVAKADAFMVIHHDLSGTWIEPLNNKLQFNQQPLHASVYPEVGDQLVIPACDDPLTFIKVKA
jgi:dihydrofolate reductase